MQLRINRATLSSDLVAGLTFALVNIPQSMAHALLVAVNPVFGLYTLIMIRVVEWVVGNVGWPVEQPAPKQLESGRVTVLYIYGNLFYAAASTFENSLPAVADSRRTVVILLMRGYEDIGSTVIGVLRRYTQALQTTGGKLMLAGLSPSLRDQLQRTGMLTLIGEENVFLATETIGEAGNTALRAATNWLAESDIGQE